jgi:signal transduction histidine kinase
LVVEDEGVGFDMQFVDRIFQPFQRLHGRSAYEGSGIGLSVCYRIVERHHGTIKAEGEVGKGARFTVTLPVSQGG